MHKASVPLSAILLTPLPASVTVCWSKSTTPVALAVCLCLLAASACGDSTGPATGAIRITVATTGAGGDPAYQVSVDDQAPLPLAINSGVVVDTVVLGSHSIRLIDIPSDCMVVGPNPVTVKVASRATADVTFDVTCATNAYIRVTVTTTGPGAPASYTVGVDGGASGYLHGATVPASGAVSIALPTGPHTVTLVVPLNCTVTTPNDVSVTTVSLAVIDVLFRVTCTDVGTLRVTAATTGSGAPANYTVGVDGGAGGYLLSADVPANGAASIALPVGEHTVRLVVPVNCTVTSPNDVPVTATAGITTSTSFRVTCSADVPNATLRVTAATTGPNAPATYTVGVDLGSTGYLYSVAIPANGAVSISLLAGPHTVKLLVPVNCTVTTPNNVSVTAIAAETVELGFAVTCVNGGAVRVSVATAGTNPDDAYSVNVDGGVMTSISGSAAVVLSGVAAGSHSIWLADIALNCTVSGPNPATVTVAAGVTTEVHFVVTCVGNGSLRVTLTTVGPDAPATYGLSVDQYTFFETVNANGAGLVTLPLGDHTATLVVPANCTVTSPNNVPATVTAGATSDIAFSVTCVANGMVRVTAVTTGPGPSGGYRLYEGLSEVPFRVPANGTVLRAMAPGPHVLTLSSPPANCRVRNRSVSFTVTSGATTDVTFEVSCVANGTLRVTTVTTGSNIPESYYVGIGPDRLTMVPANGTASVLLPPRTYTVSLSVPVNCSSSPSSVPATIVSMATTDVAFSVICQ